MKPIPRRPDGKKYKRKFLRMAALYRRACRPSTMDFSLSALHQFFEYESFGSACPDTNGYLCGKRFMTITENQVREDVRTGFCFKSEFYGARDRWFWYPILKHIVPTNEASLHTKDFVLDPREAT